MAKETVNILKDKIDIVELLAQLNAALPEVMKKISISGCQ